MNENENEIRRRVEKGLLDIGSRISIFLQEGGVRHLDSGDLVSVAKALEIIADVAYKYHVWDDLKGVHE